MRIACGVLAVLLLTSVAPAEGDGGEIHVTLTLRTTARIKGIVRGGLERLENGGFRPVEKADHPDVGYRVWYTSGTNGFFFVRHRDIVEVEDDGPVSDVQRKRLESALKALREAAVAARSKAREDLVQMKERQKGEDEAQVRDATEAASDKERREVEAGVAKLASLLEKFPPTEWKPERKEQIRSNQAVLGLAPSPREREWLESYALWKQAYDQWKRQQKEAEKDSGVGGPAGGARSTRPSASSGGAGGESS